VHENERGFIYKSCNKRVKLLSGKPDMDDNTIELFKKIELLDSLSDEELRE